ncbi:MAG: FecR domain-containing protein, partial [Opitutus sp.]
TSRETQLERIEDEAAVWAARLRGGGMTDADRAVLAAWLERDPEHRWVLSRYRELTGVLDVQLAPPGAAAAGRAARCSPWRVAGVLLAAAAAVAIMLLVLAGRPREFATKTAERHVATLDDGSRIELNAQTQLTVDLGRRERRVRVVRGEALFTVAKDAARPFFVETPAGTVRVTGTVFDVRATQTERVEVTVLEGHVRVAPGAASATADAALIPGQQAVLARENVSVRVLPESAVQDVLAWRQGFAAFDDTPLRDAVERFSAYHARTITLAPEVRELRLGGRYSLDDLEGALETIERVLPVRVERGAAGAVRIVAAGAR